MSVGLESKRRIANLIASVNETTGKEDADLTAAVGSLISGFGQGSGENPLDYCRTVDFRYCWADTDTFEVIIGKKVPANNYFQVASPIFMGFSGPRHLKVDIQAPVTENLSLDSMFRAHGDYIYEKDTVEIIEMPFVERFLPTSFNRVFQDRSHLREIIANFDCSNVTTFNYAFSKHYALEYIRFVPGTIRVNFDISWSSKLTDESIQSIIDGLADLTGSTAQTLTFHATVGAKLTDDQKATVSTKNWTLAYWG